MPVWCGKDRVIVAPGAAAVMGILNVTPDSFSDGGRHSEIESAVLKGLELILERADILDLGGESSRPGAMPVSLEEERRRVLPVLERLLMSVQAPISIDTMKPALAREAVSMGAAIVNDVGGLRDPEMIQVVAETGAAVVVMHMAGTPQTMQVNPKYGDVVREVCDALEDRIIAAERAGIGRERIAIDPGIGFGKRSAHNLALLRNISEFQKLGCVVMVGTSRKSFLGELTNRPIGDRLGSTLASSLAAIEGGAQVVRVHDVGPMTDAIRVWRAIRS